MYYWEAIDESVYNEAGESSIVQVKTGADYWDDMIAQNKRVMSYLESKYPDRRFKTKNYCHDFGMYQEVLERFKDSSDDEDEDY